ncbi:MAG: hypothetical protein QXJ68_07265 [Methanocellales archaeon]
MLEIKGKEGFIKQANERIEAKHTRFELEILKSQNLNKPFINNIRGP